MAIAAIATGVLALVLSQPITSGFRRRFDDQDGITTRLHSFSKYRLTMY